MPGQQDPLMPGAPFLQVELLPGPAHVAACSYAIQGAAKHAPATVLAGQQLVRSYQGI